MSMARPIFTQSRLLLPCVLAMMSSAGQVLALPVATASVVPPSSPTANMLQVVLGLVVVLGLMAGAAWLLKRVSAARSPAGHAIKIIGGVAVGNRERVMVVEVADQWIVVGVAPGSVNALATFPRQTLPVSNESAPAVATNFASWLKQTIDKRNAQ